MEGLVRPLKEGVEAAHKQDTDRYDLIEYVIPDPDSILDVLNKAADEGAMLVIGPVLKSSVEKIAELPYLPLPVIAINRAETSTTPGLFMSIDLTREGEVEQLVQVALENTHDKPGSFVILVTERTYDHNLAQAITKELQKLGIASEIREVSNEQLGSLRENMKDHGYRGLFFAMNPGHASLIRPYLPADLPVFGTTYTNPAGANDPMVARTEANDLRGMVTLEVPAITHMNAELYSKYRPALIHLKPEARRMFAVGVDVWHLSKDWIQWNKNIEFDDGLSGKISFHKEQSSRVKRLMDKSVVKPEGKEEFSFEEDAAEAGL